LELQGEMSTAWL